MIKRSLALILCVLSVLTLFSIFSFAESAENHVYDKGNLFTPEEITSINAAAENYFKGKNYAVYIVTTPAGTTYWGDDFRDDHPETEFNAVILIFSNNGYNYDMYTYGKCARLISNGEVNDILDHKDVYDSAKFNNDYEKAAVTFIEMSADACKPKIGLAILIGSIVGLIVAGIVALCIVLCYNKKSHSEKYPLDRYVQLELNNSQDIFIGSFVTKRRINTSSGGRSRGGRSSGGGGGHRGGR